MRKCAFCDYPLPGGCHGMFSEYDECPLPKPGTDEWAVGMAIWDDLTDRRGVKAELQECEPEVQSEIVKTMGSIAIKQLRKRGWKKP